MSDIDLAIAHDYLTQRGGAERVVIAMAQAFPTAPIFTTLYDRERTYPDFRSLDIRVSWLNRIPFLRKSHRLALPFLAVASNSLEVKAALTIVSSSGWAHGFRTTGTKIVYCHAPARWLYQASVYIGRDTFMLKRLALTLLSPPLRRWDKEQAATATKYFANSTAVQRQIREVYGIESEVLPAPHSIDVTLPQDPVDISALTGSEEGFYLCISRLLPYKNVDIVIEALSSLDLPLIVVGAGPEERRLRLAAGRSVLFFKDLTDGQIRWLYAHCRALISASYEDFGLTPVEAAAYGKPSIVLRWGGFLDTIREGKTGLYFDLPSPQQVREAVASSRLRTWNPDLIKEHSKLFSTEHFATRLTEECSRIVGVPGQASPENEPPNRPTEKVPPDYDANSSRLVSNLRNYLTIFLNHVTFK